ncbi:acylphosphatase [Microbulbifer sp. SSSA007]|uniref:acylphosphatase n=1 Tax=unclassified Microbulbifer TaxID=2619833 RepID=UPI00403A22A9
MLNEKQINLSNILTEENDYSNSPFLKVKERDLSLPIITAEAERLGCTFKFHEKSIYEIINGDLRVPFLSNSPSSSCVHSYCARIKNIAKKMLTENGVPVPEGNVFKDIKSALAYFKNFNGKVAIKPNNASMARGVTTGICTEEEFISGWEFAAKYSKEIIVEKSIDGYDLRVWVIGGKAVTAFVRIPANVVGDGISSIRHLIEKKNERRKLNPNLIHDPINRFDLIDRKGLTLDYVPEHNERVWLTSVATVGGEIVNFIDHVDKATLEIAERAAATFPGIIQAGVDLIVDTEKENARAVVLEVNSNPDISSPTFPGYGDQINTPKALLEYVLKHPSAATGNKKASYNPAPQYSYTISDNASLRELGNSIKFIKQAALRKGIKTEDVDDNVFIAKNKKQSHLFLGCMPESTSLVSRIICNDKSFLSSFLKYKKIPYFSKNDVGEKLKIYRLVLIDGAVVSVLQSIHEGYKLNTELGVNHRWQEVTREIHCKFTEIASHVISELFHPYLSGVTIIAEDISASPKDQEWAIRDVTYKPFLAWHHHPDIGIGRDVAGALLDSLFESEDQTITIQKSIHIQLGKEVSFKDLAEKIQKSAARFGISGWAKNIQNETLEMLLEGAPRALDDFLTTCQDLMGANYGDIIRIEEYSKIQHSSFVVVS